VTSETGARRPRSISNIGLLCQTRKTPTLAKPQLFLDLLLFNKTAMLAKQSKKSLEKVIYKNFVTTKIMKRFRDPGLPFSPLLLFIKLQNWREI
jgi:hypothetical protein